MTYWEESGERSRRSDPSHPLFATCVHCNGSVLEEEEPCWACNGAGWDQGPKIPKPPNRFELMETWSP